MAKFRSESAMKAFKSVFPCQGTHWMQKTLKTQTDAILKHMAQNQVDAASGMARDGAETATGATKQPRPAPCPVFATFVVQNAVSRDFPD